MHATIELRQLCLPVSLGTYGPDDVVPDDHLLDLTLTIDPRLVFIDADGMDRVFDYDPLIAEIERLAQDGHYHTQERLITRIVGACAAYDVIQGVNIALRKRPVRRHGGRDSGVLGVRLQVDAAELNKLRAGSG